eukprot:COSAG02_NODE_37910_length_436_cov_0.578635_1_plen_40_part_10
MVEWRGSDEVAPPGVLRRDSVYRIQIGSGIHAGLHPRHPG